MVSPFHHKIAFSLLSIKWLHDRRLCWKCNDSMKVPLLIYGYIMICLIFSKCVKRTSHFILDLNSIHIVYLVLLISRFKWQWFIQKKYIHLINQSSIIFTRNFGQQYPTSIQTTVTKHAQKYAQLAILVLKGLSLILVSLYYGIVNHIIATL
jgi:hypothetical protein